LGDSGLDKILDEMKQGDDRKNVDEDPDENIQ
jgi:hypothetical protein